MRLHIEVPLKAATIWLTNEDQQNETTMSAVTALVQEWRSRGFQPVIFRSGRGDLYENTAALLLNNREGAAKRAMAREESRHTSEHAAACLAQALQK